jgi:hypothetical protein
LESTQGFLRGTQTALQESESKSEELFEEICQRSTSSILMDIQIYPVVTLLEDFGGLVEEHQLGEEHEAYPGSLVCMESYDPEAEEPPSTRIFETVEHSRMRGSFEGTSICILGVVDLDVEVDPVGHPGSTMQHEYAGDDMSMLEHTVVSDSSQRHAEMYGGIQRGILPYKEETHLGEHANVTPLQQHLVMRDHLHRISSCMGDERWRLVDQQLEELLLVVLDGWDSVMTTGEYLSWIPMDELLVESLGLTKSCDIF